MRDSPHLGDAIKDDESALCWQTHLAVNRICVTRFSGYHHGATRFRMAGYLTRPDVFRSLFTFQVLLVASGKGVHLGTLQKAQEGRG